MSRPDAIKTMGLQAYLNQTATKHDGHDFDDFVEAVEKRLSIASMVRLFNVSRHTINKWLALYESEKL